MKITDYGLWLINVDDSFTKILKKGNYQRIVLNRRYIGDSVFKPVVKLSILRDIGLRINSKSPGYDLVCGDYGYFLDGYLLTESDFEEIP